MQPLAGAESDSVRSLGRRNRPPMKTGGQNFLDHLAGPECGDFARRFSKISTELGLGKTLMEDELGFLYEATFRATLCNIAFNGQGGFAGEIKDEREANRMKLEQGFMAARETLYGSAGWEVLPASVKGSIKNIFLRVLVAEENLAV